MPKNTTCCVEKNQHIQDVVSSKLIAMRGSLVVELVTDNQSQRRESGLIIIDRVSRIQRGRVLSVGQPSQQRRHGKIVPLNPPAGVSVGDIVYWRTPYNARQHRDKCSWRDGRATIYWDDVIAVSSGDDIRAPYDMVICRPRLAERLTRLIIAPTVTAQRDNAPWWGEVVAIGEDYPDPTLDVGDNIVYPRNEGYNFYYAEAGLVSLREKWVQAIIGNPDELACTV